MTTPTASRSGGATLEEYAAGIDQLNIELQRQSASYGHFRQVLHQIDEMTANPAAVAHGLPFVMVRFPQKGPEPGEAKIDMNVLPREQVIALRPVIEMLAENAGTALLAAWTNIHRVADDTRPILQAAQGATVGRPGIDN